MPGSMPFTLLLAALLLMSPMAASAQDVRGDQLITAMEANTFSGTNAAGSAFNIYFLAGGHVTYADDVGMTDSGLWHLDKNGDVCVQWQRPVDAMEGCSRVSFEGEKMVWQSKEGNLRGTLRGNVTDQFAKHGR